MFSLVLSREIKGRGAITRVTPLKVNRYAISFSSCGDLTVDKQGLVRNIIILSIKWPSERLKLAQKIRRYILESEYINTLVEMERENVCNQNIQLIFIVTATFESTWLPLIAIAELKILHLTWPRESPQKWYGDIFNNSNRKYNNNVDHEYNHGDYGKIKVNDSDNDNGATNTDIKSYADSDGDNNK